MGKATFEVALRDHLLSKAKLAAGERRLLKWLAEEPKNARQRSRRARQLARYEERVRDRLNQPVGAIDWSKIDWQKIIDFIIKILPLILALL